MNNENIDPECERIAPEPKSEPFFLPLQPDDVDSERDNLRVEKNPVPLARLEE